MRLVLSVTLALALHEAARGQVPHLMHYQGRVVVAGADFDGVGQFKFALVGTNAAGATVTFWSNDGTGAAGNAPSNAVALPVNRGLYSALLGDAAVPHMTPIPPAVFLNGDVRLRAWFNDGTHGFQMLTPDQRIAAVGFAMSADQARTVAAGGVNRHVISGTSQVASANMSYVTVSAAPVSVALPSDCAVGDVIRVSGAGPGGWRLTQNAGQSILTDNLGDVAGAQWRERDAVRSWHTVSCSADGMRLIAVADGIYLSTDGGATWTRNHASASWYAAASSADGARLAAVAFGGKVYVSSDAGATWTPRLTDANRFWVSVAVSGNGRTILAGVQDGSLFTSCDGGQTWREFAVSRNWRSVAASADGTRLVALAGGGPVYTSIDSGSNWVSRGYTRSWYAVASSADGTRLIGAPYGGSLYLSADGGVTWTASGVGRNWAAVASSADGTRLAAAAENGQIYVTADGGATWAARESARRWYGIASSADGNRLAATVLNGRLYTSAAATSAGASGYLSGAQGAEAELLCMGNGQFRVLGASGSLSVEGRPFAAGLAAKVDRAGDAMTGVLDNPAGFSGNGRGLTNLSAAALAVGTVPDARLGPAFARTNQTWLLSGNSGTAAGPRFLGTTDGQDMVFKANNREAMRIAANGGVGIGTNRPSAALDVVGTVRATRLEGDGSGLTRLNLSNAGGTVTNLLTFSPAAGAPFAVGTPTRVANLNADLLDGLDSGSFWKTGGNAGTASNHFVGTTDARTLHLKVGGRGALRLVPTRDMDPKSGAIFDAAPNVVGGCAGNVVSNGVVGATIAGGGIQMADTATPNVAGDDYAAVGGGGGNAANGQYATVPGGRGNRAAGDYSLAAGRRAAAAHNGAFVWADSQNADFTSTALNQFLVRAAGGVGVNTASPGAELEVNGYDTSLRLRNWNDSVGGFAGNTWASLQFGLYNPGSSAVDAVPAGRERSFFGMDSVGRVGSMTNVFGQPAYRNLLDDGAGRLVVDQLNANAGSIGGAALTFGRDSGEGIASRRRAGTNQWGLDLFTWFRPRLSIAQNGYVGIGTNAPQAPFDIALGDKRLQIRHDAGLVPGINLTGVNGNVGVMRLRNSLEVWPSDDTNRAAKVDVRDRNGNPTISLNGSGLATVKVLEITGGADVAEPFPLSEDDIPEGSVVVIDENAPGRLKRSDRAYDTRVAGIVSGANGVRPGLSLRQQGALDGGKHVALSGRVYALADAGDTPIRPGDLLTTSITPGHAMKATDAARARGAVLGKAMSALPAGRGPVLVLVTLQ